MSDGTRRVFLTGSGVGVAAAGLAALAPTLSGTGGAGLATSGVTAPEFTAPDLSGVTGPVVAFVHDVGAAEVSLMVGEQELVVRDRELVTRLVRAASGH